MLVTCFYDAIFFAFRFRFFALIYALTRSAQGRKILATAFMRFGIKHAALVFQRSQFQAYHHTY